MANGAGRRSRIVFLSLALLGAAVPAVYSRARAAATSSQSSVHLRVAASDGHVQLPGLDPNEFPEGLYVFGFSPTDLSWTKREIVENVKGQVQFPAPIIGVDQEDNVTIDVFNSGFLKRPDLDDAHTLHWHGFRNQIALFDGVPEVSIGVPAGRSFPYFYRPHEPGTYMYHCHFEDVEHVQMGMQGVIFVNPAQNGTTMNGFDRFVFNDGDGSTGYNREFALLLDELDIAPHQLSELVQEFTWTDYDPEYYVINGRSYPDTVKVNGDPSMPEQPISSLVQANGGERILLRLANLGYQQEAMQLPGVTMRVVGEDATLLRGPGGADLSYDTNTIYIGPGESRDVLFTSPGYDPTLSGGSDAFGNYNTYLFMNRNLNHGTNPGLTGLGGQVTEVRVYQDDLPDQGAVNQLFP
jgi:FtsP/CotA-like multicopper oxidase with cupredoxin domain